MIFLSFLINKVMSKFAMPQDEIYATQLAKLQEIGFFDTREHPRLDCYRWKCSCCSGATSWKHGPIEYDDDHNSSDHVICSWHCEIVSGSLVLHLRLRGDI